MVNPLANYYTKFYFGAVATLWATTFSFAVLFIPKVYIFYKQWKRAFISSPTQQQLRNNSACSDNTQQTVLNDDDTVAHSFLKSRNDAGHHAGTTSEPYKSAVFKQTGDTSIATRAYLGEEMDVSPTESNHRYDNTNVYVEVQEVIFYSYKVVLCIIIKH